MPVIPPSSWLQARPELPGLLDVDRRTSAALEELDPEMASYERSIWPAHFYDVEHYY